MDTSLPRRPASRGGSGASPPRRDPTDFGPIPGAAEAGPSRSRIGSSRWPVWTRRRIGLLLLGLAVLPWLPISRPPGDATPARRVRGVGDVPILTFAFAPDGATIATIHANRRVALRDVAGDAGVHSFLDHRGHGVGPGVLARRPLAGRGRHRTRCAHVRSRARGAGHPLGMPIRWSRAWPSHPTAAPWRRRVTSIMRSCSGTSPRGGSGRGCGAMDPPWSAWPSLPMAGPWPRGAASDEAIVLWDLAAGRPQRRLGVPPGPVPCLAYSPDGRWLASAGTYERAVRLWDLEGRRGERLIGSHSRAQGPSGLLARRADAGHGRRRWGRAAVGPRDGRGAAPGRRPGRSAQRRGLLARRADAGRDRERCRHPALGPGRSPRSGPAQPSE